MVLNILGTRLMLPTEPDYDMSLLPHFVKEARGTRAFRGCVASTIEGGLLFLGPACTHALLHAIRLTSAEKRVSWCFDGVLHQAWP